MKNTSTADFREIKPNSPELDYVDFATPADIARIWEQLWGTCARPASGWAMLEDGELLDLTQIRV